MFSRFIIKKYYTLIENFISFSLFKIIDAVIPLIIIPYLLTVVGKTNYGIYAFGYAFTFYLINIIQYGFSLSAVRTIAINRDYPEKINKIYNRIFTTQFLLTLVVLAFFLLCINLIPIFQKNAVVFYFFGFILIGELLFPIWFFLGMEKMRFITLINLISKSSFAVLVFLFVTEESDYIYISLYHSLGFLFAGIIAQVFIIKNFNITFRFSSLEDIKFTLKEGLSSFLTLVTPTIYSNTSTFLVGVFGIPSYVGFMEIGTKISGAFTLLNKILTHVFFPHINRHHNAISKLRLLFIMFGKLLSLTMFYTSEVLIQFWLKDESYEIIKIVKILSPSPFLLSVISAYGVNGLMIKSQDKTYLKAVAIGSIVGFISSLILIPKYSFIGGALTIIIALSIKALLTFYFFNTYSKSQEV